MRHIAAFPLIKGTFALVCMMTGKVVTTHSSAVISTNSTSAIENAALISDVGRQYSPMDVATAVTFTVAVIQVATSNAQ